MKKCVRVTIFLVGLALVLLIAPARVMAQTVTIAYNQYFTKTFGPAVPPIDAIKAEVAKEYPNIKVEFETTPLALAAMHDSYVVWFMSGDRHVDILGVAASWTAEFAEAGWINPLDDKVDPDLLQLLSPVYLAAHSYKGKVYGLGPWWGGVGGLYYRKDLLAKYGFAAPKTYDDVVKTARAVVKSNAGMTGWTWPAMDDAVLVNRWTEYLYGFGGKFFNDDGTSAVNSSQGVAALTFMRNLIRDGVSPKEVTTWKEEDSMTRFVNGQAVFHTGRQDMMFWLDNPKQSKIAGKWAFIPNPAQPGGRPTGFYEGWAFSINKNTANLDAALKVLEVMFGFPVQKQFNLSQGPLQANMAVYSDPDVLKNNPNMPVIEKVALTSLAPFPSLHYTEVSDVLQHALHAVLTGQMEPKPALDGAAKEINRISSAR